MPPCNLLIPLSLLDPWLFDELLRLLHDPLHLLLVSLLMQLDRLLRLDDPHPRLLQRLLLQLLLRPLILLVPQHQLLSVCVLLTLYELLQIFILLLKCADFLLVGCQLVEVLGFLEGKTLAKHLLVLFLELVNFFFLTVFDLTDLAWGLFFGCGLPLLNILQVIKLLTCSLIHFFNARIQTFIFLLKNAVFLFDLSDEVVLVVASVLKFTTLGFKFRWFVR